MADPLRKLERARRGARRFAADARRLAAARGRRLAPEALAEIEAAAAAVDAAADGGDPEQLSAALRSLDALWGRHLPSREKPLWREYGEAIAVAVLLALVVRGSVVEAFRIPSGSMAPTLLAGDHLLVSKLAYALRVPFTRLRLWRVGEPRRGDVIVFESPVDPGVDVVKRVIGVPGDVVELREQVLYVNGVPQPRTPAGELVYEERRDDGSAFLDTCHRFREALAKGALGPAVGPGDAAFAAEGAGWDAAAAAGVASYEVLQCRRPRRSAREGPFEVVRPGHLFVLGDNRDRSADGRSDGGWQLPLDAVKGRATAVVFSWGTGGVWPRGRGAGVRLDRLFKPVE